MHWIFRWSAIMERHLQPHPQIPANISPSSRTSSAFLSKQLNRSLNPDRAVDLCKMTKQPLDNREAIELLVNSFYEKVKKDELLGEIFNDAENFNWDTHIPIMYDFWETVLLDATKYKGNTMRKHLELHQRTPLTPEHFDRWKELFYSTLDDLFEGPNVTEAHKRVEAIGGLMQYRIQQLDQKGYSF